MPKLDKGTLALTFKFDCDRFLRFRLASDSERSALGVESDTYKRPGIELIKAAGRRWEADKYQDLIDTAPAGSVAYRHDPTRDPLVDRASFTKVDLFEVLCRQTLPFAIIEGEFDVPASITPGLQRAYADHGLEPVRARPDIIWIRPSQTGAPLIGNPDPVPPYELHVIDVKMAAEPSLRHFTEVSYYALGLAAALAERGLAERFAVSAEGFIWPGSHDVNAFRNLVQERQANGESDPVVGALRQTLVPVPYEVYQVHVRQFFEERLPRVLGQAAGDVGWHVNPKCQLCDYVRYCREKAEECDHLSRIAWLNQGQAELLRQSGIATTADLRTAISDRTPAWQTAEAASHQLRADAGMLAVRAESLQAGQPMAIAGRRSALMPAWSDHNVYITVHFDPGSGISFALGAARVYFQPGRSRGDPPQTEEQVFIVDRVDAMNPDTERHRLIEFVHLVSGWLQEVSDTNVGLPASQRVSSHVFFWDMLEVRQLRRMLQRHMNHPDVVELVELLVRFFPPEDVLPDPEIFRSQPATVVKEVVRLLLGLPIPHDYSLFETANVLFPVRNEEGDPYRFRLPFGFQTPMSDQIPFERAYELWQDTIFLRHFDARFPSAPSRWRPYTRDELYQALSRAIGMHLRALQHVVRKLRDEYRDQLVLRKSWFSAAPPTQERIPEAARSLIAFQKLNALSEELDIRQRRSLPIEEREARFFSIVGIRSAEGAEYDDVVTAIRASDPRYLVADLRAFTFAPTSRDAKISEGDFLLALSNEDLPVDLELPWRSQVGLSYAEAEARLAEAGLRDRWMVNTSLGQVFQVELVRLEAMREPPYLVLSPSNSGLFRFALDQGLIDLGRPMILDHLYRDFASKRVAQALRAVGGNPPPLRRRARRR